MTITISQTWDSESIQRSDSNTVESEYTIFGTNDASAAQFALDALTSSTFDDLVKQSVAITGRVGSNEWTGTVVWGDREIPQAGNSSYSFEISTATAHISQSLGTRKYGTKTRVISITGNPTGGTFDVDYDGTGSIVDYDSTAAQMQTAIEYSAGSGNIICTGGPLPSNPIRCDFSGTLNNQTADVLSISAISLTGGTSPTAIVEVHEAPDYKGAINVDEDGVKGVDVPIANYAFSETHYLTDASVTEAYKAALFRATGKTNDAIFKGFAVGEVMFLGAHGSKRGADLWEVNYRWVASENALGINVGNISGIRKDGFEYFWVSYEEIEDTDTGKVVKVPRGAYSEQVSYSADFATIGVGV